MNWQQLFDRLTEEERMQMTMLLLKRVERPRRFRIANLRPIHMLLPAALAQMVIFVWVVLHPTQYFLSDMLAGYVLVAALAVMPSAFSRPRPLAAHYVGAHLSRNS